MAELGLMRGIANPIYSFRVSRVRIPPLPPIKKLVDADTLRGQHRGQYIQIEGCGWASQYDNLIFL